MAVNEFITQLERFLKNGINFSKLDQKEFPYAQKEGYRIYLCAPRCEQFQSHLPQECAGSF